MSKPVLAALLSVSGLNLTDKEKYLFSTYNPLGVMLFARNLQNKGQTQKLIAEIKEVIGRDDVLIAIDEEGGRVSRLKTIGFPQYPSAQKLGTMPKEYAVAAAKLMADDMQSLGININFAPVIDKMATPQSKVLESRCFSEGEEKIITYADAMAKTYIKMGICPCIKHIPGHFALLKDPHLECLECDASINDIKKEIKYMRYFKQFPLAMTSHVILKSVDADAPATMSSRVISEIIRSYLSYDGFLLSDSLDMRALKGDYAARVNKTLDAGVDAVCCCSGIYEDLAAVCQEQRFLTEKSLIRFAKIKKVIHNTPEYNDITETRISFGEEFKNMPDVKYSYDATEVLHQMLKKGEN